MIDGSVLVDGARLAVGTLTAVPVPPPRRVDRATCAVAMLLGPVAGLVPGLAAGAICWAGRAAGADPLPTAVAAIGTVALCTRGMHLDGLADTADGLAASYRRDRALEVMRRGDTGPAGVAVLVLVLLLQIATLAQALGRIGPAAAVLAVVIGRAVLPAACARGVPAARPDGLGATMAGAVPRSAAALVLLLVTAAAVLTAGAAGGWAVATALTATAWLLIRTVRRFGGITGDVLGACVEVATTAALSGLAVGR